MKVILIDSKIETVSLVDIPDDGTRLHVCRSLIDCRVIEQLGYIDEQHVLWAVEEGRFKIDTTYFTIGRSGKICGKGIIIGIDADYKEMSCSLKTDDIRKLVIFHKLKKTNFG
ncbi:hypothetical protein A3860_17965 [Niastella vici]|uniref:DUF3846 domain-containing protein n=1 Tax=Niastella vici TaxID=1703345 RepID=A0A1V9G4R0_9BACT|nr:hypothetical protein [Niastella vici]OQP65550.1 hypothetical protein A3860_17965 [Niastella vici]